MAGINAAAKAQIVRELAAIISASGSQKETPYNCVEIRRPAATASGMPSASPTNTRLKAPLSMSRTTFV